MRENGQNEIAPSGPLSSKSRAHFAVASVHQPQSEYQHLYAEKNRLVPTYTTGNGVTFDVS